MAQPASREVDLVRTLARQVHDLAVSDEYEARRKRWRDVNERRKPDRAPVWCRIALAWREILPQESLECQDPFCRSIEYSLRQKLYKHEVGDDEIFEPYWPVNVVWDCDTPHTWGMAAPQVDRTDLGGFRYEHPIKTEADYENLRVPTFTVNRQKTEESASRMADLLGEAMPVQVTCQPPLAAMQGHILERLRGMEPLLNDLAFRPELVHRAMAKLTEGILRATRAAEESGMLTANHQGPMQCSDPVNGEPLAGEVGLHNLWTSANSQEFEVISPAMHQEFLLNYQLPVLQQFGAVQYGCCEDLSQKIDMLLRIPNLRVFVCSAWTHLDWVIEKCGTDYTIMWRQAAAAVTLPDDLNGYREHLDTGLRKLKGHHYQVVLRELETLYGHPDRLKEWARLGIELAERHS